MNINCVPDATCFGCLAPISIDSQYNFSLSGCSLHYQSDRNYRQGFVSMSGLFPFEFTWHSRTSHSGSKLYRQQQRFSPSFQIELYIYLSFFITILGMDSTNSNKEQQTQQKQTIRSGAFQRMNKEIDKNYLVYKQQYGTYLYDLTNADFHLSKFWLFNYLLLSFAFILEILLVLSTTFSYHR